VVALIKAGWLELLAATLQHWTQLPERRDREILDAEDGPAKCASPCPTARHSAPWPSPARNHAS
jgi:hypothetical protein